MDYSWTSNQHAFDDITSMTIERFYQMYLQDGDKIHKLDGKATIDMKKMLIVTSDGKTSRIKRSDIKMDKD